MWPWEVQPPEANHLESWFFTGPHLFAALYRFFKASFWGVGIHIGPNRLKYPKGFLQHFLALPLHLQERILSEVWKNGEDFNEVIIYQGYPRLRVDLRFLFLIYAQHKQVNSPANYLGYGCWNGGQTTRDEAAFKYGAFDPYVSVNIPDFMTFPNERIIISDFKKLCLNGRKIRNKIRSRYL